MSFIDGLTRTKRLRPPAQPKAPEGAVVYAVGDVHGRLDLLTALLSRIRRDAARTASLSAVRPIAVFLGDYIDRGPESRAVLDLLADDPLPGFETHFLLGNHEAEMLGFLRNAQRGPGWARHGGDATLESYGCTAIRSDDAAGWEALRQAFAAATPDRHRQFLEGLKTHLVLGDYLFVHAGVRPGRPLEAQDRRDLISIREPFLSAPTGLPYLVVHGHSPNDRPVFNEDRLGMDTGAYVSGVLTAARLYKDAVHFIQAQAASNRRAPVLQTGSGAEITQHL
jgi:serine/threonine protein phosphatase 1